MKTYHVYGTVTGSKYLGTVKAENEEEAKEKGLMLPSASVSLCHQCSEECENPEIHHVEVNEKSK